MPSLVVEERIRWSDMDTAGIMYFGQYIRLFELAETELFRTAGFAYTPETFEQWNAYPLRVNFHCDFFAPIVLDEVVRIEIWIGKLGNASLTMHFRVSGSADGRRRGEGYCTIAMVHRQTRRAVSIPADLRQALETFVED